MAEEVGCSFSMDDSFASCSILDPKVQYALKGFERQVEDWKSQIPKDVQRRRSSTILPAIWLTC